MPCSFLPFNEVTTDSQSWKQANTRSTDDLGGRSFGGTTPLQRGQYPYQHLLPQPANLDFFVGTGSHSCLPFLLRLGEKLRAVLQIHQLEGKSQGRWTSKTEA